MFALGVVAVQAANHVATVRHISAGETPYSQC